MAKGRSDDLYGADPKGAADKVDTKLGSPKPTLDVHGEKDSRFTKGNVSK